jgi:hypothetical protein
MVGNKPLYRIIVRGRENGGGFRYQIFMVGSAEPRPSQSDNVTYPTREDAERAGQAAASVHRRDRSGTGEATKAGQRCTFPGAGVLRRARARTKSMLHHGRGGSGRREFRNCSNNQHASEPIGQNNQGPRPSAAHVAESGSAMLSSDRRSASMPNRNSAPAAISIKIAATAAVPSA